jgi:hypothetical protein
MEINPAARSGMTGETDLDSRRIVSAAAQIRLGLVKEPPPMDRMVSSLASVCGQICDGCYAPGQATIIEVATRWGWSEASLNESLGAAYSRFRNSNELRDLGRTLTNRRKLFGFVMAGNIPGAGLHELVAALLAGCGAIIKTATDEPAFFANFARALAEASPDLGARIDVFNWPRERHDLTAAMREACDIFVAFGDDGTIARLQSPVESGNAASFTGFGARVSGIALMCGALDEITIRKAAEDAVRFEQRGCLSPHHVFVEDPGNSDAVHFAARFAEELQQIARRLPPPRRLSLEDAAAVRRAREIARWRSIGGDGVQLWEGAHLDWTVIYDPGASFTLSPGFRTVYVSPFADLADLQRRLAPVSGRIEAFAVAGESDRVGINGLLRECGASYICEPGRMQSPPVDWPHGGGAFLRLLRDLT